MGGGIIADKNTKGETLTKVVNGVDKASQGLSVASAVLGQQLWQLRCLKNHGPIVKIGPTAGQVRSKNQDGQWRAKRSDAGKPCGEKGTSKLGSFFKK